MNQAAEDVLRATALIGLIALVNVRWIPPPTVPILSVGGNFQLTDHNGSGLNSLAARQGCSGSSSAIHHARMPVPQLKADLKAFLEPLGAEDWQQIKPLDTLP